MIEVNKIQKNYGTRTILDEVSFTLSKGQKVALVGDNGTGKTTLFKIIAGIVEPDGGNVSVLTDACIGYLPQDTSMIENVTIGEYLRKVVGIDVLEEKLALLSEKLEDEKSLNEYSQLQDQFTKLNGYAFEHKMKIMLTGFGLDDVGLDRNLTTLSSGQKSKVVLSGILLKGVDLLLLDEPTNNLDLPALIWLEDFLKKSEATCIVISHDRRFLDKVVRKVFELDSNTKTLNISNGTYSDYLETLRKRFARQKEEYRLQQEEIERLNDQAQRLRAASEKGSNWKGSDNDKFLCGFKRDRAGRSSRVAKTIEKRIEHMDKVERPIEKDPFEINLVPTKTASNEKIRLVDLVAGYTGGYQIGPVDVTINYGSRVGIMGLNGSGKSTLIKTITGELSPISGEVEVGSGVRLGNMMQEHESLPRNKSVLDFFTEKLKVTEQEAYAKLKKFGFEGMQVKELIGMMSPGSRARLLLSVFSALSVNTLVLDEPTNHLDLEALEALEETLESYSGTILLVSHDSYFLEHARLDYTYILSDGNLTRIPDYLVYVNQAEERARLLLKQL